jgi:class 3 adenylate cyclase
VQGEPLHQNTVVCSENGEQAAGTRALLREVKGRYHAELRTILEQHRGTVEKFVGDPAMAVFEVTSSSGVERVVQRNEHDRAGIPALRT